ncbi:SDR family NAD(P)-dependent oxidoreductase [Aestuariimicrobium soli]|uniref:SDR family NAD(P)-dependent oxidoreductase n=1 Tax=Aestuariimicrobium soli TaxID=2035834 RepID=UPI003EB6FB06
MPTALITGSRRGIGAATALRLARAGWDVYAGAREATQAAHLAEQHPRITPIDLDITNPDHLAALDDRLPERLDAVVNNAAIGVLGPLEGVTVDDLRRSFEVNVVGQLAVTQAVLPRLRRSRGRIVFVSSTGGRTPVALEGAYCSSKCALEGMADVLRVELRPWQIKVSVIEPGPTNTETWQGVPQQLDQMEAELQPEHRLLYEPHLAGLQRMIRTLAPRAVDPDLVARYVERALTDRRPRARYAAGAQAAAMMALGAALPTPVGDALAARLGGWK